MALGPLGILEVVLILGVHARISLSLSLPFENKINESKIKKPTRFLMTNHCRFTFIILMLKNNAKSYLFFLHSKKHILNANYL